MKPIAARWVDINKGGDENHDYRFRFISTEIHIRKHYDPLAATPHIETLKILFCFAAHRRSQSRDVKVMFADAKTQDFNARATRDIFIDLPPEGPIHWFYTKFHINLYLGHGVLPICWLTHVAILY